MKGNLKIIQKSLNLTSFKREVEKAAEGVYVDSSLNRKLGRVGMPYKKGDGTKTEEEKENKPKKKEREISPLKEIKSLLKDKWGTVTKSRHGRDFKEKAAFLSDGSICQRNGSKEYGYGWSLDGKIYEENNLEDMKELADVIKSKEQSSNGSNNNNKKNTKKGNKIDFLSNNVHLEEVSDKEQGALDKLNSYLNKEVNEIIDSSDLNSEEKENLKSSFDSSGLFHLDEDGISEGEEGVSFKDRRNYDKDTLNDIEEQISSLFNSRVLNRKYQNYLLNDDE